MLRLAVVVLGLLFWAMPLGAQEPEAAELFRESAEAYRAGEFARAVELLEQAYAIEPAPVLQYNLARALEGMGDLDGAIAAYERYLEAEPDTRDRGAIEARLVTLRQQRADRDALEEERRRATEPVVVAEPEPVAPPPPERSPSVVPWVLVGVGVATAGAGVVTGVLSASAHDDAVGAPNHAEAVDAVDREERLALITNVLFATGGAIALAGLVWGLIDLLGSGDEGSVALRVGPGGFTLRGAF
ncbi:MAG: hypothetical protein CMN30_10115 [Sandaracinus sp.]|nr:hypothetical protein [Sandaracinus sp.]